MSAIATVDILRWRQGGAAADKAAAAVDEGLQRAGFILVTGHGVDPALARDVRAASRAFFDRRSAVTAAAGGRVHRCHAAARRRSACPVRLRAWSAR